MEVTMNITGAKTNNQPVRRSAADIAAERAVRENVILNQKLSRALELKDRVLADKAVSDSLLENAKNELAAANRTIFTLKASVAELTESLNAALASNKKSSKKAKAAEADAQDGSDVVG